MTGRFDTNLDTDSLKRDGQEVRFASLKELMRDEEGSDEKKESQTNTGIQEGPKFKLVKIYDTDDFQTLSKLAKLKNVSVNVLVTKLIHNFIEENRDKLQQIDAPVTSKGRFDLETIEGFENLERYSMMEKLLEVQAREDAKEREANGEE